MTGLVLGKFAPLHNGHDFLIRTALENCDTLVIMIYDSPDVTDIPLTVRSSWLRRLYPDAVVIEAWGGPQEVGYSPEIMKMHEDYILKLLGDIKIDKFFSSEPYGEHVSKALGAEDCRVDMDRKRFPISGTQIRKDYHAHKAWMPPIVYSDLVTKVVFMGAPSTGKSTITVEMAKRYDTAYVEEFGREYWNKHQINRRLTPEQLLNIAIGHVQLERERIYSATGYLFVDTNPITTYMFAKEYHGFALPKLYEMARNAEKDYDLFFVCDTDIPYDDTWDRSGDVQRQIFQRKILADLHERKIPYIMLSGTLQQRIDRVDEILSRFSKFKGLGSLV